MVATRPCSLRSSPPSRPFPASCCGLPTSATGFSPSRPTSASSCSTRSMPRASFSGNSISRPSARPASSRSVSRSQPAWRLSPMSLWLPPSSSPAPIIDSVRRHHGFATGRDCFTHYCSSTPRHRPAAYQPIPQRPKNEQQRRQQRRRQKHPTDPPVARRIPVEQPIIAIREHLRLPNVDTVPDNRISRRKGNQNQNGDANGSGPAPQRRPQRHEQHRRRQNGDQRGEPDRRRVQALSKLPRQEISRFRNAEQRCQRRRTNQHVADAELQSTAILVRNFPGLVGSNLERKPRRPHGP